MSTAELILKLREDADGWEGCGKWLGFDDVEQEKRNAERCAVLRGAADALEALLITGAKAAKQP